MRRMLLFSFLLLCAIWVAAQTYPSQSSSQTSSQTSMSDNKTTVQGCLKGSAGNYTLTDSSGTTWQLSGDTSKLSDHVGHTVEITGTTSKSGEGSSGTSGTPGAGSSKTQPTLNVSSMKHVSETCSSK